jgi:hypothetical protein
MLDELCSGGACRSISAHPSRDLSALATRIQSAPLHATLFGGHGRRRGANVTDADLAALMVEGDLDPSLRAPLPGAVFSALHGDAAPLAQLSTIAQLDASAPGGDFDQAAFVAAICQDLPFPWRGGSSAAQRTRGLTGSLRRRAPR